jgi:hypothetical protein
MIGGLSDRLRAGMACDALPGRPESGLVHLNTLYHGMIDQNAK